VFVFVIALPLKQHESFLEQFSLDAPLSSQADIKTSAEIVDMSRVFRQAGKRNTVHLTDLEDGATLLSIRQNLVYQATVGIDDIERICEQVNKKDFLMINEKLRSLLNSEFGKLRVHKHRLVFSVGHHSLDTLVAGLLRVQYHAKLLDAKRIHSSVFSDTKGLPISWGVGNTISEADTERNRRCAMKRPKHRR